MRFRMIGTLMGRVHLLPGTTGSHPQDKGAYPAESESESESESALAIGELERWLTIEICEQYHQRVHRGLRRSPLAAWQAALRQAGAGLGALPDQLQQFSLSFLPFERRSDAINATTDAAKTRGFCGLLETCDPCQGSFDRDLQDPNRGRSR